MASSHGRCLLAVVCLRVHVWQWMARRRGGGAGDGELWNSAATTAAGTAAAAVAADIAATATCATDTSAFATAAVAADLRLCRMQLHYRLSCVWPNDVHNIQCSTVGAVG